MLTVLAATLLVQSPTDGRKLVFSDEFNKPGAPSATSWVPEVGKIRNGEAQFYTDVRKENCRIEKGHLVIEARKEEYQGSHVTSASLTTTQAWVHPYIEVKAKIPTGRGTWPAIWMLGQSIREHGDKRMGWPECGEIDIMENVGFDPDKMHFNIHCKAYNHMKGTNKGTWIPVVKPSADYHVYGLDIRSDRMDFYFDKKLVFTFKNEHKSHDEWPYDDPHYLILNLAIGGAWGGQKGVDDAIFPCSMLVDYVRVYQ